MEFDASVGEPDFKLLIDGLDSLEQQYQNQDDIFDKLKLIMSTFEAHVREREFDDEDGRSEILGHMGHFMAGLDEKKRENDLSREEKREKITMLKAKLFIARNSKRIDQLFNPPQ